jgi:uncharacterized lipoprotein YehR (DUF1307 family)
MKFLRLAMAALAIVMAVSIMGCAQEEAEVEAPAEPAAPAAPAQ